MKKLRKATEIFGAVCALSIIFDIVRGPKLSQYERGYIDGSMTAIKATIQANRERNNARR